MCTGTTQAIEATQAKISPTAHVHNAKDQFLTVQNLRYRMLNISFYISQAKYSMLS